MYDFIKIVTCNDLGIIAYMGTTTFAKKISLKIIAVAKVGTLPVP